MRGKKGVAKSISHQIFYEDLAKNYSLNNDQILEIIESYKKQLDSCTPVEKATLMLLINRYGKILECRGYFDNK